MITNLQKSAVRLLAALAAMMFAFTALPATAFAQSGPLQIDITKGNRDPLPVAVPSFGGDTQLGAQIAEVINANLKRSGLFAPIAEAAFIQKNLSPDGTPNFPDWNAINARAVVAGAIEPAGSGRVQARFRLWDTAAGSQVTGQQFTADSQNWRRIAHIISDSIYTALTGEEGYFDSRVVFVSESGPKNQRIKRLTIMDQDGANVRYLTDGSDLVLTPRFSPSRQEITYMSFAGGQPRVYLLQLESGQREIVGNFPGMTFSPRFSPDGGKVVMSLQQEGNANLYTMDLQSRQTTRITNSPSIDTSPSFSPDSSRIVFESDRGGRQQLYVTGANGGAAQRISFGSGSYSTPVWSPRGDLIAFTKQSGGKFLIGVMRPDGSRERILTEGFHNEGPTWSPNGRYIMFFRDGRGSGGPQLYQIDLAGTNEFAVATPSFASDPAWSPLLN